MAKSLNPIVRLQVWMDSVKGQTFMNYAYSWGAAIVILGALFKLTHWSGADIMLTIGMGTEVFVFIISGFERTFDRTKDGEEPTITSHGEILGGGTIIVQGGGAPAVPVTGAQVAAVADGAEGGEAPVVTTGGVISSGPVLASGPVVAGGPVLAGGPVVAGGAPIVTGAPVAAAGAPVVSGSAPVVAGAPVVAAGGSVAPVMTGGVPADIDPSAVAAGAGLSAAAANLAAAGQAAAEAQLALSQLSGGGAGIDPTAIRATDPKQIEEAVKNYATELTELTEVLGRVKAQAARMSTDSEEMENLNRTLTGIATVYELQLKNISKQVTTIEQIDEQTRRMAQQIEELNNVYARMIQALTINMGPAPVAPAAPAPTGE